MGVLCPKTCPELQRALRSACGGAVSLGTCCPCSSTVHHSPWLALLFLALPLPKELFLTCFRPAQLVPGVVLVPQFPCIRCCAPSWLGHSLCLHTALMPCC